MFKLAGFQADTLKMRLSVTFLFFILFQMSAFSTELRISQELSLNLDESDWSHAKGSFIAGAKPLNLYSNKKRKDFQILVDDMILVKNTVLKRLPKECGSALQASDLNIDRVICKFSTPKTDLKPYSYTVMSVFSTNDPDVKSIRTVYFVGDKKDVSAYQEKIQRKVANVPDKKSSKVGKSK